MMMTHANPPATKTTNLRRVVDEKLQRDKGKDHPRPLRTVLEDLGCVLFKRGLRHRAVIFVFPLNGEGHSPCPFFGATISPANSFYLPLMAFQPVFTCQKFLLTAFSNRR